MTGNALGAYQPATLFAPAIDSSGTLAGRKPTTREAAKNVETMFLSMLLKEMRQSLGSDSSEGMFAGDSADIYGGLFDQYMGQHLTNAGGIGLSSAWLPQLEQAAQAERPNRAHDGTGPISPGRDVSPTPRR